MFARRFLWSCCIAAIFISNDTEAKQPEARPGLGENKSAVLAPFLERSVAPLKLAKGAPGLQTPFLEPRSKFFDHDSGSFLASTRQHIKRNTTASLGTSDISSYFNASVRVAVLVVGQQRVYNGTWHTHERFLYDVIRGTKDTFLDVFLCTDSLLLPVGMPPPSGAFALEGDQIEKMSKCLGNVLHWAHQTYFQSLKMGRIRTKRMAQNETYDWFLRSRPDVFFFRPMPWPPPPSGVLSGDVYGPLALGKFGSLPWVKDLTVLMFTSGSQRDELVQARGQCPKTKDMRRVQTFFHDPCVDISDQVGVVKGRFSGAYFGWPAEVLTPTNEDPVVKNFSCQFWERFPPEGYLNYRLRRAGALIAPMAIPYILSPSRLLPLRVDCPSTLPSSASIQDYAHADCNRTYETELGRSHWDMKVHCAPGGKPTTPLKIAGVTKCCVGGLITERKKNRHKKGS